MYIQLLLFFILFTFYDIYVFIYFHVLVFQRKLDNIKSFKYTERRCLSLSTQFPRFVMIYLLVQQP